MNSCLTNIISVTPFVIILRSRRICPQIWRKCSKIDLKQRLFSIPMKSRRHNKRPDCSMRKKISKLFQSGIPQISTKLSTQKQDNQFSTPDFFHFLRMLHLKQNNAFVIYYDLFFCYIFFLQTLKCGISHIWSLQIV